MAVEDDITEALERSIAQSGRETVEETVTWLREVFEKAIEKDDGHIPQVFIIVSGEVMGYRHHNGMTDPEALWMLEAAKLNLMGANFSEEER